MTRYAVHHSTRYDYSSPVQLGPQRLMLRPRDSHDLRLLVSTLTIEPEPSAITWSFDVLGNSVAVVTFSGQTERLLIESQLDVEHTGLDAPELAIAPFAETYPFNYEPTEWPDLRAYIERQYADPQGVLDRWVRRLSGQQEVVETQGLLVALMHAIAALPYQTRYVEGVQQPLLTLAQGGSCRDFAVLMMEAVRSLGLAARFASGYLYVAAQDSGAAPGHLGGGATHAWTQIYLPGAGWIDFDPTNALFGGVDLVRIAVARDPLLAAPISGTIAASAPGTQSTLNIDVSVERA